MHIVEVADHFEGFPWTAISGTLALMMSSDYTTYSCIQR